MPIFSIFHLDSEQKLLKIQIKLKHVLNFIANFVF